MDITQKEFSKKSNVPDRTLRYWKKNGEPKKNPVIQVLKNIVSEEDWYDEAEKIIKDEEYFLSLIENQTAYRLSKESRVAERTLDFWKNGTDKPKIVYLRYLFYKHGNTEEFKNAIRSVGVR